MLIYDIQIRVMKVQKGGNTEEPNQDAINEQNPVDAPSTDNQPSWWGRITGMFGSSDDAQSTPENKEESTNNESMAGGKKKRKVTKRKKCKQRKTARKSKSKKH